MAAIPIRDAEAMYMILITGAKGNIGKELHRLLSDQDMDHRALVGDNLQAEELKAEGLETVVADHKKVGNLAKAMAGFDKVILLSPINPLLVEHQSLMIEAAAKANVRTLVKLSGLDAHPESPSRILRWHAQVEERMQASGLAYTILRPHYLMQNFLMFAPTITTEGAFYAPMQNGRISAVDARDVAAVAAEVLGTDRHDGEICQLTGPEALSFRDMAEKISSVQRRRVAYVDIAPLEARKMMIASGSPDWLADALLELYDIYCDDLAAGVYDDIETITRHRPHSFDEFAVDYADAFVRVKNHSTV
jgi:uncharacterized protein YbjT (DUF2867 family)